LTCQTRYEELLARQKRPQPSLNEPLALLGDQIADEEDRLREIEDQVFSVDCPEPSEAESNVIMQTYKRSLFETTSFTYQTSPMRYEQSAA